MGLDPGKVAFKLLEIAHAQMGGIGPGILKDHKGWDPVIPHDMRTSKLPPVGADGKAECWRCKARLAFEQLDIANEAYVCGPCSMRAAQAAAASSVAQVDVETVKIGRGNMWVLPLAFAIAIGICVAVYFA